MTVNNDGFEKALAFALRWEGGYSNHPSDTGGETNRGVTHTVYNDYRRSKGLAPRSVRQLTEQELKEIYQLRYWNLAKCELLPSKLAVCHFDWAVNSGVGRAIKTLQQAVGAKADGIFGNQTKTLLFTALNQRGETAVIINYNNIRETKYRQWGVNSQAVFLAGWLNRLHALRKEVG